MRVSLVCLLVGWACCRARAGEAQDAPAPPPPMTAAAAFRPFPELTVGGGVSYRSLFGLPMTMAAMDLGLGVRARADLAVNALLQVDLGQTPTGLATRTVTFAVSPEWVVGRFRLSGGPDLVWFGLVRASDGGVLGQGGFGVHGGVTVDVLRTPHVSLFLGPRGQADLLLWSGAGLLSVSGVGGLRF